ncbi:MAG TPA: hypothetical protein VFX30_07010 [bacterium]|nr:hypothetical protein [bacterium]
MRRFRFLHFFAALTLLVSTWAVSFHFHQKEESGSRESCVVCVAGHQLRSATDTELDRAEAPLLHSLGSVAFDVSVSDGFLPRPHSSRAPPLA